MKISNVIGYINTFASEKHQYHWDNSGLQVGDRNAEVTGILICVDCLGDVIDEAIENNCNLIISHHPFLFSGVKRISDDYKSNIIKKLIKNDITVYSSHTAFDVCDYSMNHYVSRALGLENVDYLDNLPEMKCTFTATVSESSRESVIELMESVNAQNLSCVRNTDGNITVTGSCFKSLFGKITGSIYKLDETAVITSNDASYTDTATGLGIIGSLPQRTSAEEIILKLKEVFDCDVIKTSRNYKDKKVKKIAVCTGSGSDYLKPSMRMGADMYICADLKWNDFLICEESGLTAVCPTHFESEKSFISIMSSKLKQFDSSLNIFESVSEDVETFL